MNPHFQYSAREGQEYKSTIKNVPVIIKLGLFPDALQEGGEGAEEKKNQEKSKGTEPFSVKKKKKAHYMQNTL